MKPTDIVLAAGIACAGLVFMNGCENELARDREVEVRPDGTRTERDTRVIDEGDGIRIEDEQRIERP